MAMGFSNIPDLGSRQSLAVLAIVDYGSFIAAAAFLKTSQPALTRTIKRIEDVLGVSLFERTRLMHFRSIIMDITIPLA
jgi:Bacterial regulatory helix-turn-helix protein, lysR family